MECSQRYLINSSSLIPQAFQVDNQALMVNIRDEIPEEVAIHTKLPGKCTWLNHDVRLHSNIIISTVAIPMNTIMRITVPRIKFD